MHGQSPDSLKSWLDTALKWYEKGHYPESARFARMSIDGAEKTKTTGIIGKAYCCLANGAFQLQDYNRGLECGRQALQVNRKEGNLAGMGEASTVIANMMLATNQLDSAYAYALQGLQFYENAGNRIGMAKANNKIGHVFNLKGEYAAATPYYLKAYELASVDTLSLEYLGFNLSLASNYIYRKKTDEALFHALKVLQLADRRQAFYEKSTALHYLSGIYEQKGNFSKALEYERLYAETRDSVMNRDRIRQVNELEVQYETAKKESAIQLLEKDKSQQNLFIYAILATLALLTLVVIQVYRSYRRRTSDNQRLSAANTSLEAEKKEVALKLEVEARERERLNEIDAFKSRFFTNITHEFRTPLTVILGMADQLETAGGATQQGAGKSALTLIKRNGQNLLRLINDILDLAKLESNSLKMNYIQGDILAYLRYIAESMHSLANTRNVLLRVESDQTSIIADYDPDRMLQIAHNLLSNAIKFTPSGGAVYLRVGAQKEATTGAEQLSIKVSDTGVGIPESDLPRIFDRFYQAKNQELAQSGGSGVGLSLTRELVKALGGEISAESKPGKGATFTIIMPLTHEAVLAPLRDYEQHSEMPEVSERSAARAPKSLPGETPLYRMLIVEDNADVVEYLTMCMNEQFRLEYAYNGQAGIEKALESVPDIIVSDVMMPEKDGYELCYALKNDVRTSHIPIVLLTAKAGSESRIVGLRKGADAYLNKPFQREELMAVLEGLLENRRRVQARFSNELLQQPALEQQESTTESQFLKEIREFVEADLSNPQLSLEDICRLTGMSRSNLHLKFSALAGMPPMQYVRLMRLRKAKDLLSSGDMNVSEVAFATGFDDPKYFSRIFSEEYGISPAQWRKSQ